MTQKTEITFEMEQTFTLKQGGKIAPHFCPRCGEVIDMVSPDALSLATGLSEREIFRLVEAETIHFVEAERLIVCPSCFHRALFGNWIDQASDGV